MLRKEKVTQQVKGYKLLKIRIFKAACLLMIITCAVCGNVYWYNEQNSYQRARSHCLDCLYKAHQEILEAAAQQRSEYGISSVVDESYKQTLFEKCMKDKGYMQIQDYNLDFNIRKGFLEYADELHYIAGN